MEVHTHSHTARKKWTHYFWEFLMLFLAVTLGFFVENQREHYVEKLRAKEYASQLIDGLMKDTSNLIGNLRFNKRKAASFDSLLFYFSIPGMPKEKWAGIYRHIEAIEQRRRYNATTVSFEQIINSGALRYFKNRSLVKEILTYKNWIDLLSIQEEIELKYIQEQLTPFISKHFERNLLNIRFGGYINRPGWDSTHIGQITPQRFINPSPDLMTELENIVIKARDVSMLPALNKEDQLRHAIKLIELLKKEYHLK
jgi:hypothetical protein